MNEFPHLSKLAKPLDTLKNELLKNGQLPARLGTAPSEVHLFAVSNDEKSYDLRLSISAPGAKLSEEDAEKFSEEIEERFEELMIAQYGEDEGEDLALALIFVNVVLNGEEIY